MNILSAPLPNQVMINGDLYEINTDFKVWIEIESTFLNGNISTEEKIIRMLKLCYKTLPASIEDALYALMEFYLCSLHNKMPKSKKATEKNVKPIYSFEEDAPYIYSAFYHEYGIDLTKESLHWWQLWHF